MNTLQKVEDFINEFNEDNNEDFGIDSIRVEFQKQHKLEGLKKVGEWERIKKNSSLQPKLKKRLLNNEITSVWRLKGYDIYYYNMQDAPKYRKACLVIFGLNQYHKKPPPQELISKILAVMKDITNIDICLDFLHTPNYDALTKHFTLIPYITNTGLVTDTRYINDTGVPMIDKIVIYNKGFKNKLDVEIWRIEAKISIHNIHHLALPLYELKEITDVLRSKI